MVSRCTKSKNQQQKISHYYIEVVSTFVHQNYHALIEGYQGEGAFRSKRRRGQFGNSINFNRRQMISIESATTPHSFNSHLLLLLLLPHPKTPRIDKFNAFIISIVKIMNVPHDFFLVWKGPQLAPLRPLGPRLHYVGPK